MVEQCPQSGMEEIQKAVKDGNKKEAFDIMNRLFEAHTASGDLHRINALIYAQYLAESDNPSDREDNLKMGLKSAAKSVQLSPHDIDNRFILLNYYTQLARDRKDQQLVIKHCKTALKIKEHYDKEDPRSPNSSRSSFLAHVEHKIFYKDSNRLLCFLLVLIGIRRCWCWELCCLQFIAFGFGVRR